jgi:hypothetical protein
VLRRILPVCMLVISVSAVLPASGLAASVMLDGWFYADGDSGSVSIAGKPIIGGYTKYVLEAYREGDAEWLPSGDQVLVDIAATQSLGPLPGHETTSAVYRQQLTFRNLADEKRRVTVVGTVDVDTQAPIPDGLPEGLCDFDDIYWCDAAEFDEITKTLFVTNKVYPYYLFATAVETKRHGTTLAYDIETSSSQQELAWSRLENPTGVHDYIDLSTGLGLDLGWLEAGESVDVTFSYLHSSNATRVPRSFRSHVPRVPEPGTMAVLLASLFGLALIPRTRTCFISK